MSSPRYRWWGFAKRMVRDYRELKTAMDDLRSQSITANMTGVPGGSGAGRVVESIALRELPPDDQKAYDAVTRAIEITLLRPGGGEHIAMIRYMYLGKEAHSLKNAAMKASVSVPTAKRWHGDFIRLVGKCYGFSVKDDTPEPKERAIMIP